MKVRQTSALLVSLFVSLQLLACRSSPKGLVLGATAPQGPVSCTPETEGRFVGGSSGVMLNVPITGQVLMRFGDGRTVAARRASLAGAYLPCPRQQATPLSLDRDGHFRKLVPLSTDTHFVCRNGRVVKEVSVAEFHAFLFVGGCRERELRVAKDAGFQLIELECGVEGVAADNPAVARPAVTAVISGGVLRLHGHPVSQAPTVSELTAILGASSHIDRSAANDIHEWKKQGVYAYARAGTEAVNGIGLVMEPGWNGRRWCDSGTVAITVGGARLTPRIGAAALRRAGFAREYDFSPWELRLQRMHLLLSAERGSYSELELSIVGSQDNARQ